MRILLVGILLAFPFALEAQAISENDWYSAMQLAEVDSDLLYAISLKESGTSFNGRKDYAPWPWTMNISGKSMFYPSRSLMEEALKAELKKQNREVAVGMWQIYLLYNDFRVEHPLQLVEPATNLQTAAEVLNDCGKKYKSTKGVLSCYYSGDMDEAGLAYAESVVDLAKKWGRPYAMANRPEWVKYSVDEYEGRTAAHVADLVQPSNQVQVAFSPRRIILVD